MNPKTSLMFGALRGTPVLRQAEASGCGPVCLAMIAAHYGHHAAAAALQRAHRTSARGMSLQMLLRAAHHLGLTGRALRLDLDDLRKLRRPAILHWDQDHFVVLVHASRWRLTIHDPARGRRTLRITDASPHFTGIALELRPDASFRTHVPPPALTLRELLGPSRGLASTLLQILAMSLTVQVLVLLSPLLLQVVIDEVVISADRSLLAVIGLGFAGLIVVQNLLGYVRGWTVQFLSTTLSHQLLRNLFAHILRLPLSFYLQRHAGDLMSRFDSADTVQRTLSRSTVEAVVDGGIVILALVPMLAYSAGLSAITVSALLLYALLRLLSYGILRRTQEEQIAATARRNSTLLESLRSIQSIRLTDGEEVRSSQFQNQLADQLNAGIRVARLQLRFGTISNLITGLEQIAVIWLGATLILDGELTVGMLIAFLSYRGHLSARATALIERSVEFRMLGLHLERVSDIARAEPEPIRDTVLDDRPLSGEVVIDSLGYRYSGSDDWLFHALNLSVAAGESVAVTGPSGCGKSTLLRLIAGLLFPCEGRVLYDGLDLRRLERHRLRREVGAVLQDDQLLAGSIAENIAAFDPERDAAQVEVAASSAAIHDEIMRMPMGYSTLVGDMGSTLSGGQKQRILLARALYRRPRILLLDEATSHLDPTCEARVNAAISAMRITRIIVAHRAETIASADRVIQLGLATQPASRAA
jgi:ATP-binding cassette, subfamily B, bacterial CvaB/MchF/RaxB